MRKFLYTIALGIILVGAILFVLRLYSNELTEIALVPSGDFVEQDALADNAYANPDMWFSRPGMGAGNDPARWQPRFAEETPNAAPSIAAEDVLEEPAETRDTSFQAAPAGAESADSRFAVFFVHPTSFTDNRQWNATLDDEQSQLYARIMVRGMASAFNRADEIWAPRYRQATFGAFLSDGEDAQQAIDAAYQDVAAAFDYFVSGINADMPIVLAGHSQGSLHILRLMREKIAGTELQDRLAMAYPIGWPISVEHDLPALPLPACATPDQAGCLLSYSSFAEPPDPDMMLNHYAESAGFDGEIRGDSPILCVNPITGTVGGSAQEASNQGTLVPDEDLSGGVLVPQAVPARCDAQGLLLIGNPPEMGSYVLPFNNYHVYDIPLFWRNLQLDVVRRMQAWSGSEAGS